MSRSRQASSALRNALRSAIRTFAEHERPRYPAAPMPGHFCNRLADGAIHVLGRGQPPHTGGASVSLIAKALDERLVAQAVGCDPQFARGVAEPLHHIVEAAQIALQVMAKIAQVRVHSFRDGLGIVQRGPAQCVGTCTTR